MASGLLGGISGTEIRRRLLAREFSCAELAEALIDAVGDDPLHAWVAFDPERVRWRAALLDRLDGDQQAALPLLGMPVAIKDIFDTTEEPTEYGSPIYVGHQARKDAAAVIRLRDAGALIAGKVTTAEFAVYSPPPTLNPIDPSRTPGGSSSGSGAAVGAGTVPLATGTQTAGSINRPASFCGVLGYKPTFGVVDRAGTKRTSETLDTVGLLGRDLEDLRLASAVLGVQALDAGVAQQHAQPPQVAFARTERWSRVESEPAAAIERWVGDARIDEVELPGYQRLVEAQELIQEFETARSLAPELEHRALLSESLVCLIERGLRISEADYRAARAAAVDPGGPLVTRLAGYDAVLTPSAAGVPPVGVASTGDPLFCRVWTLLGTPSLSVPLVWTPAGLPLGLQLVGAPGEDRRVFEVAAWLLQNTGS